MIFDTGQNGGKENVSMILIDYKDRRPLYEQIVEKLSGAVLELRDSLETLEQLPSSVNKLDQLPSTVSQLDHSLKGLPQMMTNLAVLLKDVPDMVQKLTQQIELAE